MDDKTLTPETHVDVKAMLKQIIDVSNDTSLNLKSVRLRVWGLAKNALNQIDGASDE